MKLSALLLATALPMLPAAQAAESVNLAEIGTTCLSTQLDGCKVFTAGFLNVANFSDDDGAPLIAWQTQFGSTDDNGVIGGFILFEHTSEGWSVLDSGFDGFFESPSLNDDGLLHIAGYSQGTGAFNTDRLYQRGDGGWQPIDMGQWFEAVQPMLPAGLAIWKGVDYDFRYVFAGYTASTPLWRDDDGNCCATGGSAVITLSIVDNALVAESVAYTPPAKSK